MFTVTITQNLIVQIVMYLLKSKCQKNQEGELVDVKKKQFQIPSKQSVLCGNREKDAE